MIKTGSKPNFTQHQPAFYWLLLIFTIVVVQQKALSWLLTVLKVTDRRTLVTN